MVLFLPILVIAGCWSDKQTDLLICAANGDKPCVQTFLANGGDPNGAGKEDSSPFYAAISNHQFEVADVFLQYKVNIHGEEQGVSFVETAISERDYEALKYLKDAGVHLDIDSDEYQMARQAHDERIMSLFEKRQ